MNPNRASSHATSPLDSKVLVLGGTHIAYREAGSGSTTVLVPALDEGSFVFALQLRNPKRIGRVIAFDNVGSGDSDRPAIEYCPSDYIRYAARFLDKLVSEPSKICAHGNSAGLAIAMALIRPEKVSDVVLVNPELLGTVTSSTRKGRPDLFGNRRITASDTPLGQFLLGLRVALETRVRLRRIARAARGRDEALRHSELKRPLAIRGTKTVGVRLRTHVSQWNEWISRIGEVSVPIRVVLGERVRARCAGSLGYIEKNTQACEVLEIEGAGWYPMIEAPEAFAGVLSITT